MGQAICANAQNQTTGCVKFLADGAWSCLTATAAMASDGGGPVSADVSLCLIYGPDSGQPFLCGHHSSGECCQW